MERASRCLINVCPNSSVVRMRQVGSTEVTLQWLMELFNVKYVSIGPRAAASGLRTSVYVTAVVFTFTSCLQLVIAAYATVETGSKVEYVQQGYFEYIIPHRHLNV